MGESKTQCGGYAPGRSGAARWIVGRALLACALLTLTTLVVPEPARAAGPDAIMTPSGYNSNLVARGDDTANQVVGLPFSMNWNGTTYNQIFINMNGNCNFGTTGFVGYNPTTSLSALGQNIMAPFWSDVDTRNTSMGQMSYSNITSGNVPLVDGHPAFFVNWINVGRYNYTTAGNTQTNSFQLVIIDRSDTGAGNFDFMYNYDAVTWDLATSSSTVRARVGWGRSDGSAYELPGSGTPQASASTLLDTSAAATSLIQNFQNDDGQLGRYVFEVRGATMPNSPPVIAVVNRTLEGNAPDSYFGYTGTGDVIATDPDGTVVSLTNDMPAPLPLGTTTVTWTAIDDRGATTSRTQSVVVTDTVAPSLSTLTSSTHTVGMWSGVSSVAVSSTTSTDTCAGVAGSSYVWSQGVPAVPDTTVDPSTITTTPITVSTTATVSIENQAFTNTTTWPDWTRVLLAGVGAPETYLRSQNTRANSGYAGELWTNANGTRRTFGFYKDFDLSVYDSATLSYADYTTGLDNGTDYIRLEYSVNGGGSWISLRNTAVNAGWTQRTSTLPVGGTVRVRFSGSVDRTNEYCDWDDISISAVRTTTTTLYNTSSSVSTSTALADGTWYLSLRTVDDAGNWSSTSSIGPILIDTAAPVTTDDAPVDWQNSNVSVTLTPTDAGIVTSTMFTLDAGATTPYSSPILVSFEGTSTIRYWSADAAGHVEATNTATVRIDKSPPSTPATVTASAMSTTSAQVSWPASTDSLSGVVRYDVYRDGVLVGDTTDVVYSDNDLTAGSTYVYTVRAVDAAGNASPQSGPASVSLPLSELWLSVGSDSVLMPGIDPGVASTIMNATTISVGGLGTMGFDLTCSAPDFTNADAASPTPSFPISAMSFVTRGQANVSARAFSNAPIVVDSSSGTLTEWQYDYTLDYTVEVPWANEPGTYTTIITYTLVPR